MPNQAVESNLHFVGDDILSGCRLVPMDYDLTEDEPCLKMMEVNKTGFDGVECRWQLSWFERNEQVYVHTRNLGMSITHHSPERQILGCVISGNKKVDIVETVGRLREAMSIARQQPDPRLNIEPVDLQGEYRKFVGAQRELASPFLGVSGPFIQRFKL